MRAKEQFFRFRPRCVESVGEVGEVGSGVLLEDREYDVRVAIERIKDLSVGVLNASKQRSLDRLLQRHIHTRVN